MNSIKVWRAIAITAIAGLEVGLRASSWKSASDQKDRLPPVGVRPLNKGMYL